MRTDMATELTTVTSEPTPLVLLQQALAADVDADKLEKLMALHERWTDRQAEQQFAEAMNECQAEMPRIVRDAFNTQTQSKYAKLETLDNQIKPVYIKHGFTLTFGTDTSPIPGHIRITCICQHVGGHKRTYQGDFPLDDSGIKGSVNKTPMHATGSTMSYGRRYLTLMIFNLVMAGEDNDGNGRGQVRLITEEQRITLEEWIASTNSDTARFCKTFKVDELKELPASKFANAMEMLKRKAGQ